MKRTTRAALAKETVAILEAGSYQDLRGLTVQLKQQLKKCLEGTQTFTPEELSSIHSEILGTPPPYTHTEITVMNETTLQGTYGLVASKQYQTVGALNFASAKNPGGGFLNGSLAQEESLAMCSALYSSLIKGQSFYDYHRRTTSCLYSDRMIFSPDCPVIRNDEGELLAHTYDVSFITSAAPNAGAIAFNHPEEMPLIPQVLARRAELVLSLAAQKGVEALVLGAWGCGVFRNDPEMVAQAFASLLLPGKAWHGRFRKVVFSVLDGSEEKRTFGSFKRALSSIPD